MLTSSLHRGDHHVPRSKYALIYAIHFHAQIENSLQNKKKKPYFHVQFYDWEKMTFEPFVSMIDVNKVKKGPLEQHQYFTFKCAVFSPTRDIFS